MSDELWGGWHTAAATIGLSLVVGYLTYQVGLVHGGAETARELTKPERGSECLCATSRTCAFGIGIVGKQVCETNTSMRNIWSRCEPVENKP